MHFWDEFRIDRGSGGGKGEMSVGRGKLCLWGGETELERGRVFACLGGLVGGSL